MTVSKSLADRLRSGETLFTAWSSIPDALTVEAVARTAFDAVTLDMQHGGHDEESVLRGIPAILWTGKPAIVRIPVGRFDMASRALDFGAEAVIAPMINTIGDARAFADAMKYPPAGGRSWGPTFANPRRGGVAGQAYLESANQATMAFAMIETREAFAIVDDILGVDGIDGVFVGPSDFSIAWTGGKALDPRHAGMLEEGIAPIGARARAAGKAAAIYAVDPAQCGRFAQLGFNLVAIMNEMAYMAAGAKSMVDAARQSVDEAAR